MYSLLSLVNISILLASDFVYNVLASVLAVGFLVVGNLFESENFVGTQIFHFVNLNVPAARANSLKLYKVVHFEKT